MKILIAEDNPVSVYALKKTLEYWGHEVTAVTDGMQAWRFIKTQGKTDIIMSDWDMPKLTGPELCERIRDDPENENAYFIMLTAKSKMDDMKEGFIAGVDDYLSKPITEKELKESLRKGISYLKREKGFTDREELVKRNIIEFEKKFYT